MNWRWMALVGVVVGLGSVEVRAEPRVYGGQGEARWIQALTHASPVMRANAAKALAEIGGEEAVGPLLLALADRDADVRLHVAGALAQLKRQPERCLPALTKLLGDEDEHVRYAAAWSLGRIAEGLQAGAARGEGSEASGALLAAAAEAMVATGAADGLRLRVQGASVAVLQRKPLPVVSGAPVGETAGVAPTSGDAAELEKLLGELRSSDDYEQLRALAQLKHVDPKWTLPILKALAEDFQSEDWSLLQWRLPEAMAEMGTAIVPRLIAALGGDDEGAQKLAVEVLGTMKADGASAASTLMALFDKAGVTEDLQDRILVALGEMGPAVKEATPWLGELAGDEQQQEMLRTAAVMALSQIGAEWGGTTNTLLEVLRRDGEWSELKIAAGRALARIGSDRGETAKACIQALQKSEDGELCAGLAGVLGMLGPQGAVALPELLKFLEAEWMDDTTRAEIVRAIGEFGPEGVAARGPLLSLLTDSAREECVHVAAAFAMKKIGPEAVRMLAEEIPRAGPEARLTLVRALAAIGEGAEGATGILTRLLESERESAELRTLAAIALGKIGSPAQAALPVLIRAAKQGGSDSQLRAMCVAAIGDIDPGQASMIQSLRDDPDKDVQVAANYALAKQLGGDAEAIERLIAMLADDEAAELAERAIIDLGSIALPVLRAAAGDAKRVLEWRLRCVELMGAVGEAAFGPLVALMVDEELAEAAGSALMAIGQEKVPALLIAAEDEARFDLRTRERLREVVRMLFDGLGAGGDDAMWGDMHPLARAPENLRAPRMSAAPEMAIGGAGGARAQGMEQAEAGKQASSALTTAEPTIEADGFKTVKVFYGTNRKGAEAESGGAGWGLSLDLLLSTKTWAALALAVCLVCLLWQKSRSLIALVASSLGLAVLIAPYVPVEWAFPVASVAAPLYGGEVSTDVELGVCEVTIPRIHEPGELEGPSIFLELEVDPEKHIVLQRIERRSSDAFFAEMQGELSQRGKHVLVFVHGYNVSFADAARRTAQMAEDLKYPGAAVFYSWPSQANWYHYRLDEKNVELSVTPLKEFLLDVAERSGATTINLVAHSMGNRALTGALREIEVATRGKGKLFNQVILAAPDIDATIFRDQIAPAIVTKAEHITLYASSKDLALLASQQFNRGDARAGDAGSGLVVVPGVETIDASAGDCSLLGHCYYGSSVSVLRDIASLLQNQPAQARPFLEPVPYNGMTYWLFAPPLVAAKEADAAIR